VFVLNKDKILFGRSSTVVLPWDEIEQKSWHILVQLKFSQNCSWRSLDNKLKLTGNRSALPYSWASLGDGRAAVEN